MRPCFPRANSTSGRCRRRSTSPSVPAWPSIARGRRYDRSRRRADRRHVPVRLGRADLHPQAPFPGDCLLHGQLRAGAVFRLGQHGAFPARPRAAQPMPHSSPRLLSGSPPPSAREPLAMPGLLDRQRTIAPPGFNRWLVPPAALCIHLCIGMAYGFSVFWLPRSKDRSRPPRPAALPSSGCSGLSCASTCRPASA
jgi:hypothetical protein